MRRKRKRAEMLLGSFPDKRKESEGREELRGMVTRLMVTEVIAIVGP